MSEQQQDTNIVLLGVILVVLLISIALNVFLYKNNSMVDAQLNNPQQIQQAQASQAQLGTVGALVNDLRGYAADKPALQEILRKSGIQ
ncbi:hypothetical protein QQ056_01875 [Oscillatoria laete-virens NRMC-F 0139]|nr:hypothetical protein [Oscillatoria laete-virens]MDL5052317.1 hypothetical protein [Oscillatoria laete-virens NRMC-F 0139]